MGTAENLNQEESRAGKVQEPGNSGHSQGRVNPTYPEVGVKVRGGQKKVTALWEKPPSVVSWASLLSQEGSFVRTN